MSDKTVHKKTTIKHGNSGNCVFANVTLLIINEPPTVHLYVYVLNHHHLIKFMHLNKHFYVYFIDYFLTVFGSLYFPLVSIIKAPENCPVVLFNTKQSYQNHFKFRFDLCFKLRNSIFISTSYFEPHMLIFLENYTTDRVISQSHCLAIASHFHITMRSQ